MSLLYITADRLGEASGGGTVTRNESEALKELGRCEVFGREQLQCDGPDPWKWDEKAARILTTTLFLEPFKLAHFYSGTFSKTVDVLKRNGCKTCYTIAAHSVQESLLEHEAFGIDYAKWYPHLVEPELWKQYSAGYWAADAIVCPSSHSAAVVQAQHWELFGREHQRVVVIPHGCDLPEEVVPPPKQFRVGYLGTVGAPDKGVIYLLQAWKKLAYNDAVLVLAGRDSASEHVRQMVAQFGGGNVHLMGWVGDVADFFNSISLYVQPSVSEGYGLEVLESLARGRPALCSLGAGAADIVPFPMRFPVRDVDYLAGLIDDWKMGYLMQKDRLGISQLWQKEAEPYTWTKVRERYKQLWRDLLS